jgi:hypothetical protein
MKRKRFMEEQIITVLREHEVSLMLLSCTNALHYTPPSSSPGSAAWGKHGGVRH